MATFTESTITAAVIASAKRLGYDNLKELPLDVVVGLTSGRGCIAYRVWDEPLLRLLSLGI